MIQDIFLKKAIDEILKISKQVLKNTVFKIDSTQKDLENSIYQHITEVKNWSSEISFRDLRTAKKTNEVYIELDLYLMPRRLRLEDESLSTIQLIKVFDSNDGHIALLGQPGAGKTTSMKFLCQSIFFNEEFYPSLFKIPILIKLREFSKPLRKNSTIIFDGIINALNLKVSQIDKPDFVFDSRGVKEKLVIEVLDRLDALLIIDGFDELVYISHKEMVIEELAKLANSLQRSRVIITSRTADFHYGLENVREYEICPLNDSQIEQFANKWLGGSEPAKKLLESLKISPFHDTTIRPLTIAHLCAIYERIGKIPDKPKTVYKKIINLLLEEWDEQRNIRRKSRYAQFEIDRKYEFLCSLSFVLTTLFSSTVFNKHSLLAAYEKIFNDYDLLKQEATIVVDELESHTGLFIQSGYNSYEFAHKSLQEYLTAEYIVKLPSIPDNSTLIHKLPNELAIAVTISSNSSLYFKELVQGVFTKVKLKISFIRTFLNRLLIEKPDFNQSDDLGYSALYLYSLYVFAHIDTDSQQKLFLFDDLVEQFEEFMKLIFKRNSKRVIHENFEVIDEVESMSGNKILVLKSLDGSKVPFLKKVYCRSSFWED